MAAGSFKWLAALGFLSIVDFFTSGGLLLGAMLSTDNDTHFVTKNYSFACVIVDLLIVRGPDRNKAVIYCPLVLCRVLH